MLVRGYCRPIVDVTVLMNRREASRLLDDLGVSDGVTFASDEVIRQARVAIAEQKKHRELLSPGGPVSNAIYSLAESLGAYPRPFDIEWTGPYPQRAANAPTDPLPALRTVGVRTVVSPSRSAELPSSLCLVDQSSGETIAILVGDREPIRPAEDVVGADYVVVMASDLPAVLPQIWPQTRLALMTADLPDLRPDVNEALATASAAGQVAFLIGSIAELERLGVVSGSARVDSRLADSEVVATNAAHPVRVWRPHDTRCTWLETKDHPAAERRFLGAGDAYAGAYLGARLQGLSLDAAHDAGSSEARLTSYSMHARIPTATNLTQLFGGLIDRASDSPDWNLHNRVRQTAGTTVVTSFNSGVDTVALDVAAELGLSHFAVMPSGRRRDLGAPVDWSKHHVFELGSPSYRYCTWANAYIGDGTLLLDISKGEGSAETRYACQTLGRPVLEIRVADRPNEVFERARLWAAKHAVRTVQVAGSREAGVSGDDLRMSRPLLAAALKGIASVFQTGQLNNRLGNEIERPTIFGIPRLLEVSGRVATALKAEGDDSSVDDSALTWTVGATTIVRGRSRDLVRGVARGVLQAALVGEDMILDEPDEHVSVIARSGLHNALVAVVGPGRPRAERGIVAAQYASIARRYASENGSQILKVEGAGEGWVAAGTVDAIVDTWRTGKTAQSNGLVLREELARTSLCLIVPQGTDFVPGLASWLFRVLTLPEPVPLLSKSSALD